MSGVKPDLGKAVLMALDSGESGEWKTVRQAWREVQVYCWDADISVSSVCARLEMYVDQRLVEKRRNTNGATQYRLKVTIQFV